MASIHWNSSVYCCFIAKILYNNITTEYKYVGTIVSSWTRDNNGKNQAHLVEKCANAIYAQKAYMQRSITQLQTCLLAKVCDSKIDHIIWYNVFHIGSLLWNKETPKLETIHLKYLLKSHWK